MRFTYEVTVWDWNDRNRVEVMAQCNHLHVARAAYFETLKVRPKEWVTLKQGVSLVVERPSARALCLICDCCKHTGIVDRNELAKYGRPVETLKFRCDDCGRSDGVRPDPRYYPEAADRASSGSRRYPERYS